MRFSYIPLKTISAFGIAVMTKYEFPLKIMEIYILNKKTFIGLFYNIIREPRNN